jgi:hypothetical protein
VSVWCSFGGALAISGSSDRVNTVGTSVTQYILVMIVDQICPFGPKICSETTHVTIWLIKMCANKSGTKYPRDYSSINVSIASSATMKYNISGQGSQRSVVSSIDSSCFLIFQLGPSNSGKSVQGSSNRTVQTIFLELKLREMGVYVLPVR